MRPTPASRAAARTARSASSSCDLRDAERGHHGVAGELLDDPAVQGDALRDVLEERRHAPADDLRVARRDELRRADEIDEEDGCELAFHSLIVEIGTDVARLRRGRRSHSIGACSTRSVFKAYDVRGLYPAELDEEGAYAIGRAYVEQFEPRRDRGRPRHARLVAGDGSRADRRRRRRRRRRARPRARRAPRWSTSPSASSGSTAASCVTASHNPKEYTGMKIVRRGALPGGRRVRPPRRARPGAGACVETTQGRPGAARRRCAQEDVWPAFVEKVLSFVDVDAAPAAARRDRRGERHGGSDAAAGARAAADGRRGALLLRARRHLPEPRAEPAAAREPRVHRREDAGRRAPTSASPTTATPTGASSSTTPASSSPATS